MNTTTPRFALLVASAGALLTALLVALVLLTVPPAGRASFAQGGSAGRPAPAATDRARVRDAFGTVEKKAAGQSAYARVNVGDLLAPGTTLRTGAASASLLELPDGHVLRVGASTTVTLNALGKDRSFSFKVLQGQIWSAVRKAAQPARYDVETPSAVAGVAGTIFGVAYDPATDETTVSTDEGLVNVRQEGLTRPVSAGYYARMRAARIDRTRPVPPSIKRHGPAQKRMWTLLKQREHWMRHRSTPAVPLQKPPFLYRNMEDALRRDLRTPGG